MPATFTLNEVPGVTFTVSRGGNDEHDQPLPGSYLTIVGTSTDVDPETGEPIVVSRGGVLGP